MIGKFKDYIVYRESKSPVVSKIKLTRSSGDEEFQPFTIDKDNHSNLRIIVKAFENSPQIGVGYTTVDKNKGEVEPKLKKKMLYLTGGAVRDHLKGKTPRNYDLVTDATMSEIRMILSGYGFEETKQEEPKTNKYFYVSRFGKNNEEAEFTIVINNERFYLSPMSKSLKSRRISPEGFSAGTIEDDASTRDFTINAMYIPLKNSEGDNTELVDIYGGAHHLKNGKIVSIGSFSKRVKEDPITAHRYIRMQSRYGAGEPSDTFNDIAKNVRNIDPDYKKEYLTGLECPDIDKSKYLKMYANSGLLNTIYPVDNLSIDVPEKALGDKFLTSAWLLKDADMDQTRYALSSAGWDKQEVNDILYLIKIYQSFKNRYEQPMSSTQDFGCGDSMCGLPSYKIIKWKNLY
jgi:tRNA nucleotidyltransferase/poly(A) polymerase